MNCKRHTQMTSNYSTIDMETENNSVKDVNVTFSIHRIYTTLYLAYRLLNCKGHIHMTSNYSKIDMETENISVKNVNVTYNTPGIYTIIISHLLTIIL